MDDVKVIVDNEIEFVIPTGVQYSDQLYSLSEQLSRVEAERDELLNVLRDLSEAEDEEDFKEIMSKIVKVTEGYFCSSSY